MRHSRRYSNLGAIVAAAAFSLALAALPHARRPAHAPRPDATAPLAGEESGAYPSDWFGAQRAFPGATVNQQAYGAALEWARVERGALESGIESATAMAWQEAGPFNIGGRVTALAVAPDGGIVYLGSAAGGVFKSSDSGVNWNPVFDQVTSIGAVTLDPSSPGTVYVGTGESNAAIDNYDGAGLFRSQDGGAGWAYLGLQETRRIARVKVDPANPARIFVAAMGSQFTTGPDRGLYRSENGGLSWAKVLFANDSTGACDVAINPAHPETVFCATWERIRRPTYRRVYGPGCGIWRSADHGATWTRLAGGLPAPSDDVGRIGLAIAPSQPSRIYAQILGGPSQGLNGLGLYRSDNGGTTWVRRDVAGYTGSFGGFGWYFGDLAVDPLNPNKVFCLGQSLVVSSDGGANFAALSSPHPDYHAIWIDPANPSRVYAGSDAGFYSSTSGGTSWTHSLNLPITQFYAGTIDPSNPARILGGTQDNSTPITTGSPTGWSQFYNQGDGFYCLIDPTNPNLGFAETQFGSSGSGPQRTTNGGGSWSSATGFITSDRFNWNAPFVMDPSNHNVLLAGSYRIYKSIDNGVSYSPISGDLTFNLPGQIPGALPYSSVISTLEIAPSSSSAYYAGTTDGRVWRSQNAGGAWTEISAGLPVRWVTRMTADPANADIVYVTLSGFSQDEYAAHVYRSTNAGGTWAAIDGNLPDVPANDLLVDPANASRLFLATDVGVYATQNLGAAWSPLGTGLPLAPVMDLTLHNASRTLVAATHGRSQWKLDLADLTVAVGPETRPARMSLSRPAPNPARGETRFTLDLAEGGRVEVAVFDALGRRVAEVASGPMEPGRHRLAWSGREARGNPAPAGVYYLRAALAGRAIASRRLVRLD